MGSVSRFTMGGGSCVLGLISTVSVVFGFLSNLLLKFGISTALCQAPLQCYKYGVLKLS